MNKAAYMYLPLALLLGTAASAQAEPQTICPVMGGEINKQVYADHNGQRVYFCCPYCDGEFKKDPQQYLDKLKEQGQETTPVPQG